MKVSLLSKNLQGKILFLNHAISSRAQLPILLNFLIEAREGRLIVSATDLEIGIITEVPAKIEKEGVITVPAKTFVEIMGTLSSEKITLEATGESLTLKGDKEEVVFQVSSAEEFPKLYEDKGKEIFRLTKEAIGEFSKIVFSASIDSERPALSGLLVKEDREGFLLVATDGYRLSIKKHALKSAKKTSIEESVLMLVPSRVIKEMLQMDKGEGEDVVVYASKEKNQIIFSQGETILIGRLIEAEFPNYERIIPADFFTKTVFNKNDLHKAIKAGYVFARQTAGIIKLAIKKDRVLVSANAPSVGKNQVEIEAKTTGEENEIAFNARYLLDFLTNATSELISFEMTGPLNPGVFREEGDPSFMHLIMPIRVQQGE